MQVMPSDDFGDDVTQITSTTPINRETTPLIVNQPKKWFAFCRSVEICPCSNRSSFMYVLSIQMDLVHKIAFEMVFISIDTRQPIFGVSCAFLWNFFSHSTHSFVNSPAKCSYPLIFHLLFTFVKVRRRL